VTSRQERLEAFARFPERLRSAASAAARKPTPPGEWDPSEVARHLIAVEGEVHARRLREVATEQDPQWTWTEPGLAEGYEGASLDEIIGAFATARAATAGMFPALDDDGWSRHGTHATYGRLDVDGLLRLASDHDAEHLESLSAVAGPTGST
jgi:hypothetical protein